MAKATTIPVQFDFFDKPRSLRFDTNALCDLEEAVGTGLPQFLAQERAGLNTIRMLLWAGLKWEDQRLTRQRVGALIEDYLDTGGDMEELSNKIYEAINRSGVYKVAAREVEAQEKAQQEHEAKRGNGAKVEDQMTETKTSFTLSPSAEIGSKPQSPLPTENSDSNQPNSVDSPH